MTKSLHNTVLRITAAFFGFVGVASSQEAIEAQQAEKFKQISEWRMAAAMRSDRPFVPPTLISTSFSGGEVLATLEVSFAELSIDGVICDDTGAEETRSVRTRVYNGKLPGGLIRAQPGDILKVRLTNSISTTEDDQPYKPNEPNGFNITNLHTHGLHVSPRHNSDNVFIELRPGESKDYCFDIQESHTPGTFWYHAHRHGSTAMQLTNGLSGPLLIEGGLDEVPEIAAAMEQGREKIILFHQLVFSLDSAGMGQVSKQDVYDGKSPPETPPGKCQRFRATLLNGVSRPVITMRPGEVQRWRCIHAGVVQKIPLSLVSAEDRRVLLTLHENALDGLPLYSIEPKTEITLYPGYRSDFLVQAPKNPGIFFLMQREVSRFEALNEVAEPADYLARVEVTGETSPTMNLPPTNATAAYALRPIEDDELSTPRPMALVFDAHEDNFFINGREYNHASIDLYPRVGTAEEWEISSAGDTHPFHIHVNPFEVVEITASGNRRYWKDTLVVTKRNNPPWNPMYLRMRFEDYSGDTVLHCHNLVHEDRGMMMKVRFVGKGIEPRCKVASPTGLGSLPVKAPSLIHTAGRASAQVFNGNPRLLIFYRGLSCSHCRQQLDAFVSRREDINEAGLKVVAISPDSRTQLQAAQIASNLKLPSSFLLLPDPSLQTFKQYGCHDGRALHGVFLIDRQGLVRWQHVGDEPFTDIDEILEQSRVLDTVTKSKRESKEFRANPKGD